MENFGKRLRSLRKQNKLTQKKLAMEMGVGQTTIANYENNSRFPNPDILKAFADFFNVSIDYLVGRNNLLNNTAAKENIDKLNIDLDLDYSTITKIYFSNLREGNIENAYTTLLNLVKRGLPLYDLYANIIEPALVMVGTLWEKNKLTVGEEHYISEATNKIMSQIYFHYPIVDNKNVNVLLMCANGERHSIGLRMISDVLEQDGWNVYYLGTDIPLNSILDMIKEKNIDLIAISSTMDYNINSIKSIIENIKKSINKNIKFIVGGRPFNIDKDMVKFVAADGYAPNCKEALNVANNLMDAIY